MLPTAINVDETEGAAPVVSITRGFTIRRAKMQVSSNGRNLAYFRTKWFSLRGGFNGLAPEDHPLAQLKGSWISWKFRFVSNSGREIGTVTKKWGVLGKEFFTSADNYLISISDQSDVGPATSAYCWLPDSRWTHESRKKAAARACPDCWAVIEPLVVVFGSPKFPPPPEQPSKRLSRRKLTATQETTSQTSEYPPQSESSADSPISPGPWKYRQTSAVRLRAAPAAGQ